MTAEWEFLLHDRQAILNLSSSALPKDVVSVGLPEWSDNVVEVRSLRTKSLLTLDLEYSWRGTQSTEVECSRCCPTFSGEYHCGGTH